MNQQPNLLSFFAKKPLVQTSSLRGSVTGTQNNTTPSQPQTNAMDLGKQRALGESSSSQMPTQVMSGNKKSSAASDALVKASPAKKVMPYKAIAQESEDSDEGPVRSRKRKTIKKVESDDDESDFKVSEGDLDDDAFTMSNSNKKNKKALGQSAIQKKGPALVPKQNVAPARPSAPVIKKPQNVSKPEKIEDQEDVHIGGGFENEQDIVDALPIWLRQENIRDKNGQKIGSEYYDPCTLQVPQSAWKDFTPGMYQYWELKQDNFEKIFFFKLGKFYEIFYTDAIICQKLLDLNWMGGGKKLHIGFPEKVLDKYLEKMVTAGYKVAVVEQTENPRQLNERLKQEKGKGNQPKSNKVVKREICNMVTPGTYKSASQGYQPRYVLAFKKFGSQIGICFFDCTTLQVCIGEFEDDEQMSGMRTLIAKIRPVEVLHEKEVVGSEICRMIKNTHSPPAMTPMQPKNCWSFSKTVNKWEEYFNNQTVPETLLKLKEQEKDLAVGCFGMSIAFLEDALIANQIISRGCYTEYSTESPNSILKKMVLDSQALQHLEIVESASGLVEGSLLSYVDHCMTKFGKRQLKRWLMAPLLDIEQINDRLDAVEDLTRHQFATDVLRTKLGKLPDVEKLLAQIFKYSIKHSVKAIYFEDVSLQKMKEFRQILLSFESVYDIVEPLAALHSQLNSKRLIALTSSENEDGLIPPNVREINKEFKDMIVWRRCQNGNTSVEVAEPREGIDPAYDAANQAVNDIKDELDQFQKQMQSQYKERRIQFSHAKNRYELEVPEELVKGNKKPKDWDLQSTRQGYQRFYTPWLQSTVERLEFAEDKLKDALVPSLTEIFRRFYEYRDTWLKLLQVMTELDCLSSLAITSGQSDQPMCRPEFLPDTDANNKPFSFLEVNQMVHPCVTMTGSKCFIPNDTKISPSESQALLLVTGPNMGGKSTILRQTCIAVILAQIGCFVPAQSCKMTLVDRIFTRIGASDRILEGKSTFFVEMEETKNILASATHRSLAIVDELGRGTSTFDGYSIANSVMRHLVANVQCRSMFSTHYHMLLEDFRNVEGVKSYHMAFKANEDNDHVVFLYKFVPGECPQSFGINVARMAGIPQSVLEKAKLMSEKFTKDLDILVNKK